MSRSAKVSHRRSLDVRMLLIGLALALAGCAPTHTSPPPMLADTSAPSDFRCKPTAFIVGSLVVDEDRGISIRDDQDSMTPVIWPANYAARWSGNLFSTQEAEILDATGSVVAVTGGRYRLGGQISIPRGFWACADVVIGQ